MTRPRVGDRSLLVEAWERMWRRRRDVPAVTEAATGASCTFGELDAAANAWLTRNLPDPSLVRGRAVVFAAPNGIAWLTIFLALVRARAVIVPLDAAEPVAQQRRIAEQLRAAFWWDGRTMVSLRHARRFRDPATCLVKLTSGTTGQPRPLVFTDAQMLADARQVTASMGIRARDVNHALIPFGHSYGLGNLTLPLFAHGVPLVCGAAPLPQAIAADFARSRPTVLPAVPAIFRALVNSDVPPAALGSLRLAISAGAPLPVEVARDFAARFGRRIHSFYGSSETGGIAYDGSGAATLAGGVGRPMRGVRVSAAGGRLRVCSAAVFTHGNRRRVGSHGCWLPPDLAAVDGRGEIRLLGRRGQTAKIGSRRVNLGEVAARLRALAGVRDVWVAVTDGAEPTLGAAVASNRSAAELRAALLADTATWKVPKRWLVLAELPVTARGKIDTRMLRDRLFPT
jgi:long-chain acyl-CoA synthetase